jgi:hypothetical protein
MLFYLAGPGVRVQAMLTLSFGFLSDMVPVEYKPYHGAYNIFGNIDMFPIKISFFFRHRPFFDRWILLECPVMLFVGVYI